MRPIKQLPLFLFSFLLWQNALGADSKLSIEPLYGIETSLVRYPEPSKYVTRATYGVRALYGTTPLSAELEVTEAQSRNDYPSADQKVEDKSQRAALGIRSTYALGPYLGIYARLGGRASQGETKVTTAGVSETHENPLRVDPYAGAGLQLAFSNNFALNAGVTMVRNEENKFDSQYTFGITAHIGNM